MMKSTLCCLVISALSLSLLNCSQAVSVCVCIYCRKCIASTHGDHTIRITDVQTGKCSHVLEGHPRTPWCIAFHPLASDILASGCLAGEVRIWDLKVFGQFVVFCVCKFCGIWTVFCLLMFSFLTVRLLRTIHINTELSADDIKLSLSFVVYWRPSAEHTHSFNTWLLLLQCRSYNIVTEENSSNT